MEYQAGQSTFSTYQNSGFSALIATACLLSGIETAAVHLLVQRWSPTAAGFLLLLDLYTLLFLLAHLHAVRLRPAVLTPEHLLIRVGIVWRLRVARQKIASIQRIAAAPAAASGVLNLAKQLITVPNLLLTFTEPATVVGLYGICRTVRSVAIYVDAPDELAQALSPLRDPNPSPDSFPYRGKP